MRIFFVSELLQKDVRTHRGFPFNRSSPTFALWAAKAEMWSAEIVPAVSRENFRVRSVNAGFSQSKTAEMISDQPRNHRR